MKLPPYDCHVHTHLSGHSGSDMRPAAAVEAARKARLEVVVILEHVPQVFVGEPIEEWYARKNRRGHLDQAHAELLQVKRNRPEVLRGVEVDPDPKKADGSLMLDRFHGLAWRALGVHCYPGSMIFWTALQPVPPAARAGELRKYTDWLITVFRSGKVDAWVHPGAMIAQARLLPDFSAKGLAPLESVFAAMAENDIAFELNELLAQKLPGPFLGTYPDLVNMARAWGIRFVVGSDAHRPSRVGARDWVASVARRAVLSEHDFLGVEEIRALAARHQEG